MNLEDKVRNFGGEFCCDFVQAGEYAGRIVGHIYDGPHGFYRGFVCHEARLRIGGKVFSCKLSSKEGRIEDGQGVKTIQLKGEDFERFGQAGLFQPEKLAEEVFGEKQNISNQGKIKLESRSTPFSVYYKVLDGKVIPHMLYFRLILEEDARSKTVLRASCHFDGTWHCSAYIDKDIYNTEREAKLSFVIPISFKQPIDTLLNELCEEALKLNHEGVNKILETIGQAELLLDRWIDAVFWGKMGRRKFSALVYRRTGFWQLFWGGRFLKGKNDVFKRILESGFNMLYENPDKVEDFLTLYHVVWQTARTEKAVA